MINHQPVSTQLFNYRPSGKYVSTIYRWIKKGEVPCFQFGGRRGCMMIPAAWVEELEAGRIVLDDSTDENE